jgi:predicted Zn-dependent protease
MKKIVSYIAVLGLVLALLTACEHLGTITEAATSIAVATGNLDAENARRINEVGYAAGKAFEELTPENEYYIGRAVAANITSQYKIYTENPALQLYLNKICSTITVNSPRPEIWNGYHVAILDTQEINAFATSGGHVFLTRGLIACTSTEDELASVIAHEIAHIQLQHGLKAIQNARFANVAATGVSALAGSISELADIMDDSVGEIMVTMITKGYSREQEYDADATALSLLASAGYEPSAILGMLHALEKNEKSGSGFGKTHPAPGDRISSVNKSLGSYKVPDTQEFRRRRYVAVKK